MSKPDQKSSTKRKGRGIITYRSYSFTQKDPIIDKMRTMVKDSGNSYSEIHEESGVSVSTLHNWFEGNTKRPVFSTIAAVAGALGKEVIFVTKRRKR
jgi:transcriptional regulator with XRE-family HTH domain